MLSEKSGEKDHKSSEDKTMTEKTIESLVTILFVFASWITERYLPGLNGKTATDFCTQQGILTQKRNVCCTVIDIEVSDDQKKSAEIAGVTLIPARRKTTVDPKRNPPKLEWLLNHEIHFPNLGQLENVKFVVGHDSMTADAARDIRDSLFPDAELHLLKVDLSGVLVVFDKWDVEKYGLPEFHRNLLKDILSRTGKAVKVYATVLDVSVTETQREDAEKAGITLIPARRAEHLDPEDDPINIRWLSYPESYYRQLRGLPKIQYVIGYAPMTAKAAAIVRNSLFPQAKLYQINAINPDYHATMTRAAQHSTLERNMLDIAKMSDAMVSIGPSMYDYFENAYRAITDRDIPHIELLPKVGECFHKQRITLKKSTAKHVILSYGEVHEHIVSDFSKIAPQLGKVASALKEVRGHSIKWNILDIPTELSDGTEKQITELLKCDLEVAKLKPTATISQLSTHFQQSHLCVIGSCHADFGFYGLESIAAGLPTYTNRDSQLGSFIIKYLKSYKEFFLVGSEQEWHDKVMAAVEDTETALKWAKKLKKAYLECKEIDESHGRFAALFTEGKRPSEDLPVAVELDIQTWQKHLRSLSEQLKIKSRKQPLDQSAVVTMKKAIHEVSEALNQCQQSFKRKVRQMISEENDEFNRLCNEENSGVNQAKNFKESSLGMLLNFLSILGLYRFKSSVQTGRFADIYEPWLITDEMREIAAKVNLPLKLQVIYDEKKFDELDAFFIERDGGKSDQGRHLDGKEGYRFERQPQTSLMEQRPALHISKLDTDIEDKFAVGAMRLILFKLNKVLQSQRVSKECLPRILNIDSSAVLEHISCGVIQVRVKITERVRNILIAKQEILSLLGIRAFLVTDKELERLSAEAIEEQFETHGNTVSAISISHGSLLLRSLLLYNISQSRVGSYRDLCFLDLEQTGRERCQQTEGQILRSQQSTAREGKFPLEKNEETLKELDKANEDDQFDITMRDINEVVKELEKARKEAEVFKTQLDEVKEGKSLLEKLNQERLEEFAKAEKVTTEKTTEVVFLKEKIQDLEKKLAESRDLMTKMQAQLSNAETELGQSKDLVAKMQVKLSSAETEVSQSKELMTKMQAKLSDAENKVVEIDTLRSRLDKTKKEFAQLEDQLGIAVKEKKQIQEELDRERKVKHVPQGAAYTEPQPIGGEKYIGWRVQFGTHGGHTWTLQILGSVDSGTEPGQFNEPKGLAWHGDQLVICDTENHRIKILNKDKVVIEIIRFDGHFKKKFKPWDVAISRDGHFFITDIGNNQIIICDQNKKIIQIIPQSEDLVVRSITVMGAFIFVTDSKDRCLIKYNIKDGKLVARVSDRFSFPHSVMATSNNHLLVSDYNEHVIHVFDSDLNFLNSYRNDRLKSPRGLDVDSHGNIYICTRQSTGIVKLRSDGQLDCVLFEGDVYYPEFIAVNDDITTEIATTEWIHQIKVYSVST